MFLALRLFFFAYCLAWAIHDAVTFSQGSAWYHLYLAHWGEWTLVVYFLWAVAVTIESMVGSKPGYQQVDSEQNSSCCFGHKCCQQGYRIFFIRFISQQ